MLYLTCTMISNVHLAYYGVSRAKDWVSVDCCLLPFGDMSEKIIHTSCDNLIYILNIAFQILQRPIRCDILKVHKKAFRSWPFLMKWSIGQ